MTLKCFRWGSRSVALLACTMLVLPPTGLRAQTTQAPAPEAADESAAAGDEAAPLVVADELDAKPVFTMDELEQLVGPIALYPDPLLVQVLLASTYPLDVVKAHRFAQDNAEVTPEELVDKAELEGWDPSVISLVAFPTVLDRMATDLDWTESLGDAMTLQSEDLLDAVQNLREQAQAAGALQSNEYQTVAFSEEDTISIEPAKPEVIYVPQYEPEKVFVTQPASTTYVTQPAPTTVVQQTGHSDGTLLMTGLIAFTTGIILGSYFSNKDKYYYYWGPTHRHVVWHHHRVYPPYYRPGGYRPPHYRPRPPGYRPGDYWRPRPELYRDARKRVDRRREVTRDIKRDVNVNIGDRQRPAKGDRAANIQRELKDRGRDRPDRARPGTPQRPATRDRPEPRPADRARPAARPGPKDTAFGDRARPSEVRKNRDRGAASRDRAKAPAAAPSQRPARPAAGQRPQTKQKPQLPQRPKADKRVKPSRPAFEKRGGRDAAKFGDRGRSSAGGRQRNR